MIDSANIFSFKALPTEVVPFDETTLNVLIRDLPKVYPFDVVLFDGSKHTITKELDLYDFLLVEYYDIFMEELENYRQRLVVEAAAAEEAKTKAKEAALLQKKHDEAALLAMTELEEARKAFTEKYGDANAEERLNIDKEAFIEKAIERNEVKQHNDRVRRQLQNKYEVSLSQYDSKYLDCEVALFDKLRTDSFCNCLLTLSLCCLTSFLSIAFSIKASLSIFNLSSALASPYFSVKAFLASSNSVIANNAASSCFFCNKAASLAFVLASSAAAASTTNLCL
jgi:hypothetical protein